MDTEELPKAAWRGTLGEITRAHNGEVVTMEVIGRQLADQIEEVDLLPLAYVEYDSNDDVVLRHIIEHPHNVRVHPPRPVAAEAIDVVAADGTQTLLMLRP